MHADPGERPGPSVELERLYPNPRTITVGELLGSLALERFAGSDRPYTIANFVESVDGRAAFQGRSGPLGSDVGDRSLFHGLREIVDAVLVGSRTLGTERYGRMTRDPERRQRRVAAGLSPEPLAVTVTRSGELSQDIPLFEEPEARIAVFAQTAVDTSRTAANVQVHRLDPGEMTMTTALRRLRVDHGVRVLLCEGGPTIFGALVEENLVDELFLTVAPSLTGGGTAPAITSGPGLAELREVTLAWALERAGTLFLRYQFER
ncbi:MAG: dihydrofolate reductase family protein [Solirubrobacterales bacterium]|nr:dihydrofolate reductase family protein [Solirubrobacterales bacterium]